MQKPRGVKHAMRSRTKRWKLVFLGHAALHRQLCEDSTYIQESRPSTHKGPGESQCPCVDKHTHKTIHGNRQCRAVHECGHSKDKYSGEYADMDRGLDTRLVSEHTDTYPFSSQTQTPHRGTLYLHGSALTPVAFTHVCM